MVLKIKDDYVAASNSKKVAAYLTSKAMRKEPCDDAEIKKIYSLTDAEFKAAADILVAEGIAEKK